MRKTRMIVGVATVAAATALAGMPAAVGEPAETPTPSEIARVEVPLSHPVTVDDALTLVDDVDLDVVGVRHEQPGIEGEYFINNGQSVEAFLESFETETGTQPQAVALIAEVEATTSQSERSTSSALDAVQAEVGEVILDVSADLPEFTAPLAVPTAEVDAKVAAAAETVPTDAAARLASATWFPHYNEIYALQSFTGVEGADAANVAVYSIWNGGSNSPDVIPTDWGIEVDTYQYNSQMLG